jgi:hypothetical protein
VRVLGVIAITGFHAVFRVTPSGSTHYLLTIPSHHNLSDPLPISTKKTKQRKNSRVHARNLPVRVSATSFSWTLRRGRQRRSDGPNPTSSMKCVFSSCTAYCTCGYDHELSGKEPARRRWQSRNGASYGSAGLEERGLVEATCGTDAKRVD